MKKIKKTTLLIIVIASIMGVLVGYPVLTKDKYYDAKKAVWSQLSEGAKETVLQDWENAKVRKVRKDGAKVLEVTFWVGENSMLGDLIVYVDPTTYKIISTVGRS